jgi:phosphoribosylamine--glycine ligase
MGDPETQPIMLRLKSDLYELLELAVDGGVDRAEIEWDRRAALGVVLAAADYPETPRRGDVITGLDQRGDDFHIFHAGTALQNDAVVTAGGRVLCVTALGDSIKMAQRRAYQVVDGVRFDGMQHRRDIGFRAIDARAPRGTPRS